jgi:signal peptide peptidase SppA
MNLETLQLLAPHGDIWCLDASKLGNYLYDDDDRRVQRRMPRMEGRVAIIPVHGVLTKRGGWGVESTDRIAATVDAAMGHKGISGVLLDVDSPGGSSYGLQEFADRLHGMRDVKPIVAIGNPMAASAAYWTASAASRLAVTPSGDMGHIGVWSLHIDYSQMMAEVGIKPTFIFAGKHKVDGNPFEPLSEDARADMQASVNATYDAFVEGVAKNRGRSVKSVRSEMADGRIYSAKDALQLGLVDRVATLEQVLGEMGATSATDAHSLRASRDAGDMLSVVWSAGAIRTIEDEPYYIAAAAARRKRERSRHIA